MYPKIMENISYLMGFISVLDPAVLNPGKLILFITLKTAL